MLGISVDTAVDAAKDAADVVLLQKDPNVLEQGVLEGRKTFTNMLKYIKITASSNFGNIFSIIMRQCIFAVFAHDIHPDSASEFAVRYFVYCSAVGQCDEEETLSPRDWSGQNFGTVYDVIRATQLSV